MGGLKKHRPNDYTLEKESPIESTEKYRINNFATTYHKIHNLYSDSPYK